MEQKNPQKHSKAAKILVTFLGKYIGLLDKQIEEIRQNISDTTNTLMKNVCELDIIGEDGKKLANAMLIKRDPYQDNSPQFQGDDRFFQNTFSEDLEESQQEKVSHFKTTENFKNKMQELNSLDEKLKNIIFSLVGFLSNDDVVRQRLSHVSEAMILIQSGLSNVLLEFENKFNNHEIDNFIKTSFQLMYKQYTMEEEKDCFQEALPLANNFL